jgi:iron complex outermembrane receptor protein
VPGGGTETAFLVTGSEPLKPETSHSYTFGVDYRPSFMANTRLTLNYFNIDFSNRIITPPFVADALLQPAVYGSLITQFPDDAAAQSFLNEHLIQGAQFFDLVGNGAAGIRYALNASQINAAEVRESGGDLAVDSSIPVGANSILWRLSGTYISHIDTRLSQASVPVDIVNTYSNPLRFRARADLSWVTAMFQVNGALNFYGRYTDTSVFPYGQASSWTTFDLNARFTPPGIKGFRIGLNVINVFDKDPPYVGGIGATPVHYDVGNASPLGRFISIDLRKSW